MKRTKIMLPVNDEDKPDYVFMEEYMKAIEKRLLKQYKNYIDSKCQQVVDEGGVIC